MILCLEILSAQNSVNSEKKAKQPYLALPKFSNLVRQTPQSDMFLNVFNVNLELQNEHIQS